MNQNSIQLDATDLQLLQLVQEDCSRSNQALAALLQLSPPTCLRRVRRLQESGLIERQVAILQPERLAAALGHGLQAIVEVSLDRQDSDALDGFERRAVALDAVQQCWRVSAGPDFILVVAAPDMPAYLELSRALFTGDANVRNVKSFFSVKRAKFSTAMPLPSTNPGTAAE